MRTWPALEVGQLDEPDLFQAALLDFEVAAIDETTEPWRVFFSSAAARDEAAETLARRFPDSRLRPLDVPDEDWVARSQANLRAVTVGRITVAPPWDVPPPEAGHRLQPAPHEPARLVIVIRPSMGFGTGHHATTRLCLAALQRIDLSDRRVIDIGTGSGLLAIAASFLGAAHVVGIDDDPDACRAAEDNLSLNPGATVTLRQLDLREMPADRFDVAIANLTGALLRTAARHLADLIAPRGTLILSGFMAHEASDVLAAYSTFTVKARTEEEEWVCVTLGR